MSRIYPNHEATFRGDRSWSGARPEGRVIGYDGTRPIAHLGFLRRMVRIDGGVASFLVGDVGLVGVEPECQGSGHGRHLLTESATVFGDLELPFGFVMCRPAVKSESSR